MKRIFTLYLTLCLLVPMVSITGSAQQEGSFSGQRMKAVSLPVGLTSIGDQAFFDCDYLTSVTVPGTVKEIGSSAFGYCNSLTSAKFEEGITSLSSGWFPAPTSRSRALSTLLIPKSVTHIYGDLLNVMVTDGVIHYAGTQAEWDAIIFESWYGSDLQASLKRHVRFNSVPEI